MDKKFKKFLFTVMWLPCCFEKVEHVYLYLFALHQISDNKQNHIKKKFETTVVYYT